MSEHKSLAEALLAFQADAPALPKDGRNPHFKSKFTKLDTIREKVGPLLVKHGLTWQTFPCFGPDGQPALRYVLTHAASGDSQSDVMPLGLPAVCKPQDLGSAYTYARRYGVVAVLDLVADEDDDGNAASGRGRGQTQPANGGGNGPRLLTAQERDRMLGAIADTDQNEQLLFAAVGVSSIDEVTIDHARKIRELIDKAVAA